MFHSQVKLVGVYDSPEDLEKALKDERKLTTFKHQTPPPAVKDDNEGLKRMVENGYYLSKSWVSKPQTSSPTQFGGLHGVPLPRGAFGGAPVPKGMGLCQMSHSTLFAVLWERQSPRLYEGGVSSTSSKGVRHVELFVVLLP